MAFSVFIAERTKLTRAQYKVLHHAGMGLGEAFPLDGRSLPTVEALARAGFVLYDVTDECTTCGGTRSGGCRHRRRQRISVIITGLGRSRLDQRRP